jgi:hypothetical protein
MAVNFGYISLFCVAFPLGPLIYWLSNIIEIKVDSYKFLTFSKRPFPEKANNIGIWEDILRFVTLMSVITNICLIVFNNTLLPDDWTIFLLFEHIMFACMGFLFIYIAPVDKYTANIIKRHDFLSQAHAFKEKPLKFTKARADNEVYPDDMQEVSS